MKAKVLEIVYHFISYDNIFELQESDYSTVPNNRGGIIGGMENFWKTNKREVGLKKGKSGWERKQKTQIVEVDISNKHTYSYVIRFSKLFLVFLYAFAILLCTAVN